MGEDETVDFESLKQTYVFWNIDDYPIAVDGSVDVGSVFDDMLKALDIMGFRDQHMTVMMYSEQLNYDKKDLCDAEVIRPYLHQSGSYSYASFLYKVPAITVDMIRRATMLGPGPINFWVIAKPKRELERVLQCLKSRRHNVLRCPFRPDVDEFLFSVDSLLENSRLLGGGKPRFKDLYPNAYYEYDMYEEKYVEIKEDVSKTVDFSERIPTIIGARTAVFWDAVDCPFPLGSTPDEIYNSISSALVARDFSDNVTIWAYLDDDHDNKRDALLGADKTWASRIYFLPGGDKASRRIRMLNDIFLWMRDSPRTTCGPYEASVVLVADQFKDDAYYVHMLQKVHDMRYDLIFVTPTSHINKPESPEWPGLLIDKGAACFAEPSPQKLEADAAAAAAAQEEETPEMLPVMSSDLEEDYSRPCRFGDDETSSESSDDEYLLLHDTLPLEPEDMNMQESDEWPGSEEACPEKNNEAEEETTTTTTTAKFDPIYRWDPINMCYNLYEEEDEADDAKEETTDILVDLYRWDPFTMTMNKFKSLGGGTGRQIDGGSGWGNSEEPYLKKHKANAAEEETSDAAEDTP
ncbi:unnamed protein product [Eruca vesicaria subsp. sativa]|uniref:NYN domain-containing protein n=1 Tax=Eruca vesicaria subsp. sativa TaxID=29727 RepID=A0ABC8JIH4_ERUVS|nr:unnamed protein product [Eruca vesicaria subsp. sativa]